MATTYLTRAMNGNSEYTGTISLWLKRTTIGASVISTFWEDSVTYQRLQFDSSDLVIIQMIIILSMVS